MIYKVRFRPLKMSDVDDLFEIYSDQEAMKYRGSKPMKTIDDAKRYVEDQELFKDQTLTIRKGVELMKTKELIGSVMFRFHNKKKRNVRSDTR